MRWSKALEHGHSRKFGVFGDLVYEWGEGCRKADGALLHARTACERQVPNVVVKPGELPWTWEPSFVEELIARGYDITTIKFSIKKTESATNVPAVEPDGGNG